MSETPQWLKDLWKYLLDLKSSVTASREYSFLRKTFIRLCVFAAVVVFTLWASKLIGVFTLPPFPHLILHIIETVILLVDALWFTVSLAREIADWLREAGFLSPAWASRAAVIIMILLCFVAIGANVFGKYANNFFDRVDNVIGKEKQ